MCTPRVILWATPRSISCAFLRSMMTIQKVKPFLEPFSQAFYFGTERVSERYQNHPPTEGSTYQDVSALLAEDYQGASCVFVKDMAYYLIRQSDPLDLIPDDYVHTFLIRNPMEAVPSLYDVSIGKYPDWNYFDPSEAGFEALWQMYTLIEQKYGGKNVMIIDAEDLLSYPESVLKEYCRRTGLPFSDKMIEWGDEQPESTECFAGWEPWLEHVLKSKGLHRRNTGKRDIMDYPKAVREEAQRSMTFYEKLRALKYCPRES